MSEFLRDCWYVACGTDELGPALLARTLLDIPMTFYRTEDGRPVALHDRCPHRFVSLSLGQRVGDDVRCIYHGLQFGPDGACTYNPHDRVTSSRVRVQSFPVVERYGYIWVWPGDAELADAALLPDLPFLEDETTFRAVRGHLSVKANYQLITDNLLDLSHVEFLHPMFKRDEGVAGHKAEFHRDGHSVVANRWKPNTSLNDFARLFWDFPGDRGDGRANMRWTAPAVLYFDLGTCEVGGEPEKGICTPAAHLLTPETGRTTHYFWAQGRNRRLDDVELDQKLWAITDRIFRTEDLLVIEDQQRMMGAETDLLKMKPLLLKSDAPTVLARRIMEELLAIGR